MSDNLAKKQSSYVPGLDGLRVFAVVAVMLYHLNYQWAQGGLLGVTIFFVLSGYLITTMLIGELHRSHTVRLGHFWWGRIRRLFPAIFTVIGVTALLMFAFDHVLLTKMKPDIAPSLFWAQNWWYVFRDMSYFESMGSPSPLVHFWSLAIEEQFYLVWPLILMLVYKIGARKKAIGILCLVLAIASAVWMSVLYDPTVDPTRVYYGTDTRAFSLLFGGFIACVWPQHDPLGTYFARHDNPVARGKHAAQTSAVSAFSSVAGTINRPASAAVNIAANTANGMNNETGSQLTRTGKIVSIILDIAAALSLAGLIYLMYAFAGTDAFMFRGGIALATVLSGIIIMACVNTQGIVGHIIGCKPLAFLGKRTYGMYLWHYPFVLLAYQFSDANGQYPLWTTLAVFGATIVAALLMYMLVEHPLHRGKLVRKREEDLENEAGLTSETDLTSETGDSTAAEEEFAARSLAGALQNATPDIAPDTTPDTSPDTPQKKPRDIILTIPRLVVTFAILIIMFGTSMFFAFITPEQQYVPEEAMTIIDRVGQLANGNATNQNEMLERIESGIEGLGSDTANYTGSEWTSHYTYALNSKGVYDPYIIGDSVSASVAFNSVFPHARNNSIASRSIAEGTEALQKAIDDGVVGKVIVFSAFNNSWIHEGQLEAIMEIAGEDRDVFFIAPRTPYTTVNNADWIEAIVATNSRAHMIDWRTYAADHVSEWLYKDKVHMNQAGTNAYLKLVASAIFTYLDKEDLPDFASASN